MTKVNLHGILRKKFGKEFYLNVFNANSALRAIDANRNNFLQEIKKLHDKGYDYVIVADGNLIKCKNEFNEKRKIKNIDIMPVLGGSGPAAAFIIPTLISAVVSVAVNFIMMALTKQAQPPAPQAIAVGGATAAAQSTEKSYVFTNNQNVASQGDSIAVGYGRFKIASHVISASIKNYSTSETYSSEFSNSNLITTDLFT